MRKNLANTIRNISLGKHDLFNSSLKEELNSRLYGSMANVYIQMCENLYVNSEENINESVNVSEKEPLAEEKKEIQINSLIANLQESIKNEKTIVHKFQNGDSVVITNEDSKYLITLHDSLNKINQEKMRRLMSENYSEYNKILQFSKKHTERTLR
jgi:hypothetical protein